MMKTSLFILVTAVTAFVPLPGFGGDSGFADLVERLQGAVVNIQTRQQADRPQQFFNPFDFFEPPESPDFEREGSGSGFLISEDGYIVTNRHVVTRSTSITVQLSNNKTYEGRLIGTDDSMDIALIKIEGDGFSALPIGDSDRMRIGDTVLAMGYPLQLGFSVTRGIISGIGRNMRTGGVDLATYIQSDADITFGNSGGPLVNDRGEVIGINTMIVSRGETFGFAIPSNLFMHSISQLKSYGRVKRGALGIRVGDLSPEALEYYNVDYGAMVASVTKGMPAERAGLAREDIILEIDGVRVEDSGDVVAIISSKPPGASVKLRVLSNGALEEKTITLTDRGRLFGDVSDSGDPPPIPDPEDTDLGFSVAPLNDEIRLELGLDANQKGMVVTDVPSGSLAARRGLSPGAVVTHVNRKAVSSLSDLRGALRGVSEREIVPVEIIERVRGDEGTVFSPRTLFLRKR